MTEPLPGAARSTNEAILARLEAAAAMAAAMPHLADTPPMAEAATPAAGAEYSLIAVQPS